MPRGRVAAMGRNLLIGLGVVVILMSAAQPVQATTDATQPSAVPDVIGGCPTAPITSARVHAHAQLAVARAAADYAHTALGWKTAAVNAVYRVGRARAGSYDVVFAHQIPIWCGKKVAAASYGVELTNPSDPDQGTNSRAALVVAHFADGWQVWGRFYF